MPPEPTVTRTECARTHDSINEWQNKHYEYHLQQAELLGGINTTLNLVAEEIKEMHKQQEGLKKFQWRATGAYIAVTVILSVVVTVGGLYVGFKRLEADYVKKTQVPFYEMIETMNIKSANASELPEGVVEKDEEENEPKKQ